MEHAEIKFDESPYNLSSHGIQGCKIDNIFSVRQLYAIASPSVCQTGGSYKNG